MFGSLGSIFKKSAPVIGGIGGAFLGGPAGAMAGVAAGSAISGAMGQEETNLQNKQMAENQMKFQERMSSTAYQRSMNDMKRAGLNPALAFQQGGASSPAGATATMENPMTHIQEGATASARAYMEKQINENILKKTESDIGVQDSLKKLQEAQTASAKTQNTLLQKDVPKAQLENELGSEIKKLYEGLKNNFNNSAKPKPSNYNYKRYKWDFKNNRAVPIPQKH
jgi:hypothetical protein